MLNHLARCRELLLLFHPISFQVDFCDLKVKPVLEFFIVKNVCMS